MRKKLFILTPLFYSTVRKNLWYQSRSTYLWVCVIILFNFFKRKTRNTWGASLYTSLNIKCREKLFLYHYFSYLFSVFCLIVCLHIFSYFDSAKINFWMENVVYWPLSKPNESKQPLTTYWLNEILKKRLKCSRRSWISNGNEK